MTVILVVIYIAFISLGLPDSLFGSAWPAMHVDLNVAESFGSFYSIIIAVSTGGVSFCAGALIRKFGTGLVTFVSVLLTAIGLLGVSFSSNIYLMMIFSIISGLGAGAIDTGLNNFVALHYKAMHMNFLHCFWGVGVTISPIIMSRFLADSLNWQGGYRVISYIQFGIALIILLSLGLWKKHDKKQDVNIPNSEEKAPKITVKEILTTKGVVLSILALGFYMVMELLIGTWGSTYLVNARGYTEADGALFVSLYYGGIMLGRVTSGFASLKLSDKTLIRIGITVALVGIILCCLPFDFAPKAGLMIIGFGFGPIFPSFIHAIPDKFGKRLSTDITGYQSGGSYAIGFVIQVVFSLVATSTTFEITPYVLLAAAVLFIVFNELTNKKTEKENPIEKQNI